MPIPYPGMTPIVPQTGYMDASGDATVPEVSPQVSPWKPYVAPFVPQVSPPSGGFWETLPQLITAGAGGYAALKRAGAEGLIQPQIGPVTIGRPPTTQAGTTQLPEWFPIAVFAGIGVLLLFYVLRD